MLTILCSLALPIIDDAVLFEQPHLVVLYFGMNDAVEEGKPQHVPIKEFQDNLRRMVQRIKQTSPETIIILLTPSPIDEEKLRSYSWSNGRTNAR